MPLSDNEELRILYPLDLLNAIEQQAFEHYSPWLIHALSTCVALPPINPTRTLQLVDYGCSEGKTSLSSFSSLKAALEEAGVYGKVRVMFSQGHMATTCPSPCRSPLRFPKASLSSAFDKLDGLY